MDVNSAFNSGLQALHRADHGLRRNAETIVRHSAHLPEREDLNTALVESKAHLLQAQAAVTVLGSLLDVRA